MSAPSISPKSHPCDACGGSGYSYPDADGPLSTDFEPCPVCQGSGRISDVIPARDAVADAVSLLAALDVTGAKIAQRGGFVTYAIQRKWNLEATAQAIETARAAFRACPGLRGE